MQRVSGRPCPTGNLQSYDHQRRDESKLKGEECEIRAEDHAIQGSQIRLTEPASHSRTLKMDRCDVI